MEEALRQKDEPRPTNKIVSSFTGGIAHLAIVLDSPETETNPSRPQLWLESINQQYEAPNAILQQCPKC
jgi:hypothetical protein